MQIERIEPIAIHLPLTKPMKMAGVTLETADNVLVRIDSSGISGWGEAASAPSIGKSKSILCACTLDRIFQDYPDSIHRWTRLALGGV